MGHREKDLPLDIFKGNIASLGVYTIVRHHFPRCIMQYPSNRCQKLEVVYMNFRIAQGFKIFNISRQNCEKFV